MKKTRVVIIGAGHVGSHCCSALAAGRIADEIVLIDCIEEKAAAQARDISDSISFLPSPVRVWAGDYSDCTDADIVVVSVGKPRVPGQTRLQQLDVSIVMAREVAGRLRDSGFKGIVIGITNPADIIADCLRKELGFPRERAFSTGTLLDTGRLLRILSELTGLDRRSISAYSLGEHGDSSMIPFSQLRLGEVPFSEFEGISKEQILERTRNTGISIIQGKGSTEFGIGFAAADMIKAILNDEKRVLPASVLLQGEYGISGVHCGVPVILGRGGAEKVIELKLTQPELRELEASCRVIREHTLRADTLGRQHSGALPV